MREARLSNRGEHKTGASLNHLFRIELSATCTNREERCIAINAVLGPMAVFVVQPYRWHSQATVPTSRMAQGLPVDGTVGSAS
jgi:hypothetical protein